MNTDSQAADTGRAGQSTAVIRDVRLGVGQVIQDCRWWWQDAGDAAGHSGEASRSRR